MMKIIILIIFFSLEVVESKGQEASEMEDIFQNGRRWNSMCEGVHAPWLDRTFFMVGYKYEGKKVVNGHYCRECRLILLCSPALYLVLDTFSTTALILWFTLPSLCLLVLFLTL